MMEGWKTWVGALIMVGLGAYLIAVGDVEKGVGMIGAAAATIGIGNKLDKLKP